MKTHIRIFDPEKASDELWDLLYPLFEKIWLEMHPDDPLPSKETTKKDILLPDPDMKNYRWLAYNKDETLIIGYGRVSIYKRSSPAYYENKHIAFGSLFTDQEFRRSGIGTELLKILMTKVLEEKKTVFQGGSHLPSAYAFCKAFGGKIAITEEESRLNLAEVDWNMIEAWKKDGPLKAKGASLIRFETVAEDDIEDFCQIYTEVLNQVPKEDVEWEAKETPETRRQREDREKKLGAIRTTFISKEADGTISGITETFYHPDRKTILDQGLTGVKEEYRGRGLGKWLKAEMLSYVRERFPDVGVIATDFALTNDPMIAINRRLGFKFYKKYKAYKFDVEELSRSLQKLETSV
ncbi:MAG: GNAT family N-acetyltransferase [Candidatus Hodarchaeota archaeon]